MKKLLYVSENTKKLYRKLISLKGSSSFTRLHQTQIEKIELMDEYLNPNRGIQAPSILSK